MEHEGGSREGFSHDENIEASMRTDDVPGLPADERPRGDENPSSLTPKSRPFLLLQAA